MYKAINRRVVVILLILFALTGCDMLNPGLGPDVDMSPPVLSVSSPFYMQNVSRNFTIKGTVKDDTFVSLLIIEIEGAPCVWKHSDTGWEFSSDNSVWKPVSGTWTSGTDGMILWSVDISLPDSVTGEIVLMLKAQDSAGNMGAVSVEKRTVISDTTAPSVYVTYPELFSGTSEEADAHYSSYVLENVSYIAELFNGDIVIKGYQDENSRLGRLEVELADAEGTIYWQKNYTDSASLRNFTVNIPASELSSITTKTVLQVVINSYDAAGNSDKRSHGWLCYWPDADRPWVTVPGDSNPIPSVSVYPQQTLEGQAFDDDGLAFVNIYIEENISGWQEVSHVEITANELNKASSYTWQVSAPQESGTYRIRAVASDINGVSGNEKTAYFSVEDISSPRITVETPVADSPMLGDANGDVIFSGYADDDSGVAMLRIVWINPEEYDSSLLSYLNKSYSGWDSPGTDAKGNKVFDISSLGAAQYDGNGRFKRDFSLTLNLFSDIGISPSTPLSNQTFVLRAVDDNNKASTLKYVVAGDNIPPSVRITGVTVKHSDSTTENYTISDSLVLPAFSPGDQLRLKGTWSDNSTDIWADKSKIGEINLDCDGQVIGVTRNFDGSWQSDYISAPTKSIISVQAEIKDMGGNIASDTKTIRVESNVPELVRITSPNDSGRYKAGDIVDIYLEFNKTVSFSGGSNEPVLILNNGAYAYYYQGNNSNRISFRYTVQPGDDVSTLDVSSISISGSNNFADDTGTMVDISVLPSGINSLSGGKIITIDTIQPYITGVRILSPSSAYKAGDTVIIAADLSEPVVVDNNPALTLSSGLSALAVYSSNQGSYLRFSYIVAQGENAEKLTVSSITSVSSIKDLAGNPLSSVLPSGGEMDRDVIIDTDIPIVPSVDGITDGTTYYGAVTFTVTGAEPDAVIQYSINNGITWITGSAGSIAVNGSYEIVVRQIDKAGNISSNSNPVSITIDSGSLLTRISSSMADGIYKEGDKIEISLNFRKALYITSSIKPYLILNTTPQRTAVYKSGSGTNSFIFEYSVQEGDTVPDVLDVDSIAFNTSVITDSLSSSENLSQWIDLASLSSDNRLSGQKDFFLLTSPPQLQSCQLMGSLLTLSFDRNIYKGSGNITITQDDAGLKVPVLLSPSEYSEIASIAPTLASIYKLATNGASDNGTPLLDAVYVLDFSLSPDDPSIVSAYKTAGLHKISIPVNSSYVSISGSTMKISLEGSYSLPVKGASYTVEIDGGLVYDQVSHINLPATAGTIELAGVEKPVIRVNRRSESLSEGALAVVAAQPLVASVKMDSLTPGAAIHYTLSEATYNPAPVANPNSPNLPPQPAAGPTEPPVPTGLSTLYTGSLTVGSSADTLQGYKSWIKAVAIKGTDVSEVANEVAFKSVVSFIYDGGRADAIPDYTGSQLYDSSGTPVVNDSMLPESMWLRGSDDIAGPPTVPGLPLSWDNYDYDGVRLMTQLSSSPQEWYWISWEIVTTTYIGLLWGTTPDTTEEAARGPWRWGWHKNAYVPFRSYYPLFPGESRRLQSSLYATIDGQGRGEYIFARPGDGITFIRDYLRE
ncbi:hypothetical protein WKV44_02220 [Spirochaetia bacterium 38H-sp]|uniref:Ig-like domain-containing protein n=1 Tax=Rarispira pelagica TaxID=3141764 RepID=A0ABU9U9K2_9SPIR